MAHFYYDPAGAGLEIVAEIYDGGYDWSAFVVFRKLDDGTLLWGTDSGCSCYGPFDSLDGPEDLNVLNKGTWNEFAHALSEFNDYDMPQAELGVRKVKLMSEVSALVGR